MMRRVLFSTVLLPSAARAFVPMAPSALSRAALATRGGGARALSASPIAIVVNVEIKPERVDDFLAAMAEDVRGSREEAGCYRFDLLRDQSADNKFVFYEVYKDAAAVDVHKATPHFKVWSDFKESGGVVSQVSAKYDAIDFTE